MIDIKLYKYLSINVTLVTLKGISNNDEGFLGKKNGKLGGVVTSAAFSATGKNGKHEKQEMSSNTYMSDSYTKKSSMWELEKSEYMPSKKTSVGPKVYVAVVISDENILKNADVVSVDLEFISDDRDKKKIDLGIASFCVSGSDYGSKEWLIPIELLDIKEQNMLESKKKKTLLGKKTQIFNKLKKKSAHTVSFCHLSDPREYRLSPASSVNVGLTIVTSERKSSYKTILHTSDFGSLRDHKDKKTIDVVNELTEQNTNARNKNKQVLFGESSMMPCGQEVINNKTVLQGVRKDESTTQTETDGKTKANETDIRTGNRPESSTEKIVCENFSMDDSILHMLSDEDGLDKYGYPISYESKFNNSIYRPNSESRIGPTDDKYKSPQDEKSILFGQFGDSLSNNSMYADKKDNEVSKSSIFSNSLAPARWNFFNCSCGASEEEIEHDGKNALTKASATTDTNDIQSFVSEETDPSKSKNASLDSYTVDTYYTNATNYDETTNGSLMDSESSDSDSETFLSFETYDTKTEVSIEDIFDPHRSRHLKKKTTSYASTMGTSYASSIGTSYASTLGSNIESYDVFEDYSTTASRSTGGSTVEISRSPASDLIEKHRSSKAPGSTRKQLSIYNSYDGSENEINSNDSNGIDVFLI